MYWNELSEQAKNCLLNFKMLIDTCVKHTDAADNYYTKQVEQNFYFSTGIAYPLMNGLLSFETQAEKIEERIKKLEQQFVQTKLPVTWFWPHDVTMSQDIQNLFERYQFATMGQYTSISCNVSSLQQHQVGRLDNYTIQRVSTEADYEDFILVTQEVYQVPDDSILAMTHLYGAYKNTDKFKLYIAKEAGQVVATLATFCHDGVIGLYNGATLDKHRKKGLLTSLILNAIKSETSAEVAVAQLMAGQQAKGVVHKLGFQALSCFTPMCLGFNVDDVPA